MNGDKLNAYLDALAADFELLPTIQEVEYRVDLKGRPYRTTLYPKRQRKAVLWLRCYADGHGPCVQNILDPYINHTIHKGKTRNV